MVAQVAGQQVGDDLAAAVLESLVAAGPAVEDQAGLAGPVALAHDVVPRADLARALTRRPIERSPVLGGQSREILELADEKIGQGTPP